MLRNFYNLIIIRYIRWGLCFLAANIRIVRQILFNNAGIIPVNDEESPVPDRIFIHIPYYYILTIHPVLLSIIYIFAQ